MTLSELGQDSQLLSPVLNTSPGNSLLCSNFLWLYSPSLSTPVLKSLFSEVYPTGLFVDSHWPQQPGGLTIKPVASPEVDSSCFIPLQCFTLEKEMATHSSSLAWRIPWTEEPGRFHCPWGRKESDTTEWLTTVFHSSEPSGICPAASPGSWFRTLDWTLDLCQNTSPDSKWITGDLGMDVSNGNEQMEKRKTRMLSRVKVGNLLNEHIKLKSRCDLVGEGQKVVLEKAL